MKHTPHNLASYTLSTLALAALLLTGCTQEKTSSAPSPEVSQSASASSSTASKTEVTSSPAPTPSPIESTSYSGGSKAPAGEYRPADEFGPAQNVPRPVEPEGMNVESVEGMLAFIDYWTALRNYGYQTGDFSEIKKYVPSDYEQELKFYEAANEVYSSGGWVIGGLSTIHYNKDLIISHGNGEYSIGCNIETQDSVIWYMGEARYHDNSDSIFDGVDLRLRFTGKTWQVTGAKVVS